MMRLYLLPISTRRTLLYAHRFHDPTAQGNRGYVDRAVDFAARTWAKWEKKESGWQRKVVNYGNHAFRRIPYEEWGLKSVPPLSARRRTEESKGHDKIQLVFPRAVIPTHMAESLTRTLATEREGLHRKRMIWCIVAMPITIPVAILPVIPNLPFFYLVYRAWSHWRAIMGGRHVQWLIQNRLLSAAPSDKLDSLYPKGAPSIDDAHKIQEKMLLTKKQAQVFSEALEMPALAIELERAVWQVEQSLKGKDGERKDGIESSHDTRGKEQSKENKDK